MRKARFAVILLLVAARVEAAPVALVPGASPVPDPIPFSPLPLTVETAAGMVPPRPGCPQGSLVLFGGNQHSVFARPLLDPAASSVAWKPVTGTTARPSGWDGQLQRLINGDLLVLFNSESSDPVPAGSQPSWWNQWFAPAPADRPAVRNGFRHVEMLWRTSCGVDAASWEPPMVNFDTALLKGTDPKGIAQAGYCGKKAPGLGGLDRPQLAVDPWGVDPNDPRRQRIFLASMCDRGDDSSVQVWTSNDTGKTWPTAGWRLPVAGMTALTAVASGRLFVLQCDPNGTVKVYWSDDHGKSKAGEMDITQPGLPCAALQSSEAGVSQPDVNEESLARIGPDSVVATYPSVETVSTKPFLQKRQVYPVVRIGPGPDGKLRSYTPTILRAMDATGSVLQAQLVEEDRQIAADRTAVLFWLETSALAPNIVPGFPGRNLKARALMIRDFGPGTAASPMISFDVSDGTWFWATTENQGLGDFTKGGFAVDEYGVSHFVLSWPEVADNKVTVLTPSLEPSPSRFNAIWRKGAAPSEFGFRLSTDELKARDQDLYARGYRLSDINTMVLPEGLLHNAVWRKSTANTTWITGWTHSDLLKQAELLKKDFRLASIEGFMMPDGLRYNAVWTATTEERPWIAGWTLADFLKQNEELAKQGFQLYRLHSFLMPEGLRYDAIWVKSQTERPWIAGWTFEDFIKKNQELRAQKFDLLDLQAVVLPEGPRYDAVWEPRIGLVEAPSIPGWEHLDAAKQIADRKLKGWTLIRLYGFVMPK
jgi:hypothetical protein